jgi:hypothetical protein
LLNRTTDAWPAQGLAAFSLRQLANNVIELVWEILVLAAQMLDPDLQSVTPPSGYQRC